MGGSPKIDGGMTADEHRALLAEEREFQAEQETIRRERALEDEANRREEDRLERERLADEERLALEELEAAERATLGEISSQDEAEADNAMSVDFFGSLQKGISTTETIRPE